MRDNKKTKFQPAWNWTFWPCRKKKLDPLDPHVPPLHDTLARRMNLFDLLLLQWITLFTRRHPEATISRDTLRDTPRPQLAFCCSGRNGGTAGLWLTARTIEFGRFFLFWLCPHARFLALDESMVALDEKGGVAALQCCYYHHHCRHPVTDD